MRTVAIGSAIEKAPQAESVEWQLKGLCRSKRYNPDMWSPFENHERRALLAKDVCVQCPVLQQCREWALSHHEEHGVWGGLSEGDRQRLWTGKTPIRRYRKNTIAAFGEIVSGDQPHG